MRIRDIVLAGVVLGILLGLWSRAHAFNADAALALREPAQTLADANKVIAAEQAKCPQEYKDGSAGVAFFHLAKGEKQGSQVIADDHTVVKGYVCLESVTTRFQRAQMFAKAWWLAGIIAALCFFAGYMLTDTWITTKYIRSRI